MGRIFALVLICVTLACSTSLGQEIARGKVGLICKINLDLHQIDARDCSDRQSQSSAEGRMIIDYDEDTVQLDDGTLIRNNTFMSAEYGIVRQRVQIDANNIQVDISKSGASLGGRSDVGYTTESTTINRKSGAYTKEYRSYSLGRAYCGGIYYIETGSCEAGDVTIKDKF